MGENDKESEIVTVVTDFCKICGTKTVKKILEINNHIVAECIQCETKQIIAIDTNRYFDEYKRKGGRR